jgi:nicotinate dehydrogenase subunit B
MIEQERYELSEAPRYRFEIERREFLGGVAILLVAAPALAQESGRRGGAAAPREIAAWIQVAGDGQVTVFTGKVDVGQNNRTSLSQAVAEELRVPLEKIRMVMGDTERCPFDAGTFGSQSTPQMAPQLRRAAAAARQALADPTRAKTIDAAVPLTPPDQWKVIGKSFPKIDGRDFVTGRHQFTTDIRRPGMMYGKVLRPPAIGATLESLDSKAAEAIPGVVVVRDGAFAGVAASDEHTAARALAALKPVWKTTEQPAGADLFDILRQGAVKPAAPEGEHKLSASYTIAYIAHAPLEPRAAVAEWNDDRLTVWTGTQRPFGVRGELAQAFRITPDTKVRVMVPDTGSGYGGKHTGEAAVEAARLAKAAGKPVKLIWTREEEFHWAYSRPAGVIDVAAGVRADGAIASWEFHNYNSGGSAIRSPYNIPGQKTEFHRAQSPLRQGSYRGLAATANHFARESHMDDLSRLAGLDPLEFRRRNSNNPRLTAVLEAAAAKFGWTPGKAPEGRGIGIAGGFEKGSYVATCAEVAVDNGKVKVLRAVISFECGAIVNPDQLKNQVEGSLVQGLGGALFEAVEFDRGRILNPRFSRYRVPRFSDVPPFEVVLLDRKDLAPLGAGETPIVAIAPAIGNAIFHATGVRIRSLPMIPTGMVSASSG